MGPPHPPSRTTPSHRLQSTEENEVSDRDNHTKKRDGTPWRYFHEAPARAVGPWLPPEALEARPEGRRREVDPISSRRSPRGGMLVRARLRHLPCSLLSSPEPSFSRTSASSFVRGSPDALFTRTGASSSAAVTPTMMALSTLRTSRPLALSLSLSLSLSPRALHAPLCPIHRLYCFSTASRRVAFRKIGEMLRPKGFYSRKPAAIANPRDRFDHPIDRSMAGS